MKYQAIVAQSPNPSPDLPAPKAASEWAIVIAAGAFLLREGFKWVRDKDQGETALTQTLINDLRTNQAQLIEGNKEGFKDVAAAMRATGDQISKEVQGALKAQALNYAEHSETLNKILQRVDALHLRLDDHIGSRRDSQQ